MSGRECECVRGRSMANKIAPPTVRLHYKVEAPLFLSVVAKKNTTTRAEKESQLKMEWLVVEDCAKKEDNWSPS